MPLTVGQLIECWGLPEGGCPDPNTALGRIWTDSRSLQVGDFFVPLLGNRFDGHHFLSQLLKLGAQGTMVERTWSGPIPSGLLHWRVDDTMAAYQQLALLHRRDLNQLLVAVTGSVGKTTTRELIRAALTPLGAVHCSANNNNNDVGVPFTVLAAKPEHRVLVIEMGMRGPGEIERLSRCTEPDVAVITNVGTAHIGRLGSREAIAAAKCEITTSLKPGGVVVILAGDPLLDATLAKAWSGHVLRVRLKDDPPATADRIGAVESGYLVVGDYHSPLPLEGRHNARNFLLATTVAEYLGAGSQCLPSLPVSVPNGRSRRFYQGGLTILDETYNASPEAVVAALALLAAQPGRHFAVLGTMLELGEQSLELHRMVAAQAAAFSLDGLVIVDAGNEGRVMAQAAGTIPLVAIVMTPERAAQPLKAWLEPGDVVLLKASRAVALDRLIPLLPLV
ncbi:UDP-N-acetylmuramoyl-tripeptide--D-alanyl-D-alanine ligase [Synechococcus sp. M16CYN]|uniref:UDP-N-acetylmuramoyl-tripeptide--D-alanyl-D- alanine ligase n=1 Tax=Synechococcus sp. M16CYN TaxID=3103139 RepID=UPI00324D2177